MSRAVFSQSLKPQWLLKWEKSEASREGTGGHHGPAQRSLMLIVYKSQKRTKHSLGKMLESRP